MNRRQFLTALGLSGVGSALARPSWAVTGPAPKRLVILSTGHGTPYPHWQMRPTAAPDDAAWVADLDGLAATDFSRSLAPLHVHRRRLQCLDGLSLATAELDIPGYRHEKGWLHAWTGAWVHFTGADLFSTEPSLDQIIARQIARPDRLPSLELTIGGGRPICHAGMAQQMPLEGDPRRIWDRLFGVGSSEDPSIAAASSVLDFAKAEHQALAPNLAAADRAKLDTHYELVRQLEQRLAGLSEAACDAPDIASLSASAEGYNALFDAFAELVGAAFACDLVRVVTVSLGDLPSRDFGWGHYLSGDAHNDFAHRIYEDPLAAEAMSDYSAHHAAQVARLVSVLEAIPEDGGSLMDNTLIVWGSELADGWHTFEKYCVSLLGGSWAWETGRYHHWPWDTTPVPMVAYSGPTRGAGRPHQQLLTEVARAMGVEVDHVGLDQVTTPDGHRVDLTGGLGL